MFINRYIRVSVSQYILLHAADNHASQTICSLQSSREVTRRALRESPRPEIPIAIHASSPPQSKEESKPRWRRGVVVVARLSNVLWKIGTAENGILWKVIVLARMVKRLKSCLEALENPVLEATQHGTALGEATVRSSPSPPPPRPSFTLRCLHSLSSFCHPKPPPATHRVSSDPLPSSETPSLFFSLSF